MSVRIRIWGSVRSSKSLTSAMMSAARAPASRALRNCLGSRPASFCLGLDREVGRDLAALEEFKDALVALLAQDANLVFEVAAEGVLLLLLDVERALVALLTLAREDLHLDDRAVDARRADERRVLHVAGLLAEDGAEQFLFGRQLRLALRRDLANKDGARLDLRADADDARLVEVAEHVLADVRNVARDLLRPKLRVAGFDLKLLDVR